MLGLTEALNGVLEFLARGGPILLVIAAVTFFMWTLIFERIWFYKGALNKLVSVTLDEWEARAERRSWNAKQIRYAMISRVAGRINQNLDLVGTCVALCPLLGLLGTVYGMIQVFGALASTGGGDAKALAAGVSMATIPTMAGMVAALSGVFGSTMVNRTAEREGQLLEDHLTMDH